MKEKEPLKLWDRFHVLYGAEGRSLQECHEILCKEGFAPGLLNQFRGRWAKRPEKREWDRLNAEARTLKESLEGLQDYLIRRSVETFNRLKNQLAEKDEISVQEAKDLIHLAHEIFLLSNDHPKYNTKQNINIQRQNAEVLITPAIEAFYQAVMEFEPIRNVLADKRNNREFVALLKKKSKPIFEKERLLNAAPETVKGVAPDA